MTKNNKVPMLNNAGSEIIRATRSCRIPLANSSTLSSLAILKIRMTRRRLGLTTVSLTLISSSTTPVKCKKLTFITLGFYRQLYDCECKQEFTMPLESEKSPKIARIRRMQFKVIHQTQKTLFDAISKQREES